MLYHIVIILLLLTVTANVAPYRWTVLDDGGVNLDVCNKQKCEDRDHSSCAIIKPHERCRHFKLLPIGPLEIEHIVNGHNGLRNRVAKNNRKSASNMNLLHWDDDLYRMAKGWIIECIVNQDNCKTIYNSSFTVGQNIRFERNLPAHYWTIKIIREWFLSGNAIDPKILDNYDSEKHLSFTQLVWAETEFVGCAAAMMENGYVMACNYHPKGNVKGEPVYKTGRPCTDCSLDRPSCSRIFKGLCGIDRSYGRTIKGYPSVMVAIISFTLLLVGN